MRVTQADLAEALGVTQPAISLWVCGRSKPRPEQLEKIKELSPKHYEKIMEAKAGTFTGITQQSLKHMLQYHDDGTLTWKVRPAKGGVGDTFGHLDQGGYLVGTIMGRRIAVHRVVWLYHHGYIPEGVIDHMNRIKTDNRIENLREATRSCNAVNNDRDSTSGVTGVNWSKPEKMWEVSMYSKTLGHLVNFDKAVMMRFKAELEAGSLDCRKSTAYEHLNRMKARHEGRYKVEYTPEELLDFNYWRED